MSRPDRHQSSVLAAGAEPRELLALRHLEGVERRKGLKLDQLRLETSVLPGRHGEVRHRESREGFAAGDVEALGHGGLRAHEGFGRRELPEDLQGRRDHLVAQLRRQEDGRFRQSKRDRGSAAGLETPPVLLVLVVAVGGVVRGAKGSDHREIG